MAEIERCLEDYAAKYVTPEVVARYKYLKEQHAKEGYVSSTPIVGSAYGSASMYNHVEYKFKPEDTKGILDYVTDKVNADKNRCHDIDTLIGSWRDVYTMHYGADRYDKISVQLGQDLATYYVNVKLRNMMLERLAQEKVPRSTIEYVMRHGAEGSLFGIIASKMTSEEKQKEYELAKRLYNPSMSEKVAGEAASFAFDMLSLGPLNGLGSATGFLGKEAASLTEKVALRKAESLAGTKAGDEILARGIVAGSWMRKHLTNTVDTITLETLFRAGDLLSEAGLSGDNEELSELLYGDKQALGRINSGKKSVDSSSLSYEIVNESLHHKVDKSFMEGRVKSIRSSIVSQSSDSGYKTLELMQESLKQSSLPYQPNKAVPQWMKERMSEKDCISNAGFYLGVALEMKAKGHTEHVINNRKMALAEITQQAYDYARAASWHHERNGLTETEKIELRIKQNEAELRASGLMPDDEGQQQAANILNFLDSALLKDLRSTFTKKGLSYIPDAEPPKWMQQKSEEELMRLSKVYRNLAVLAHDGRQDRITLNGGKVVTVQEATQLSYDYARAAALKHSQLQESQLSKDGFTKDTQQMSDDWDARMAEINASLEPAVNTDETNVASFQDAAYVRQDGQTLAGTSQQQPPFQGQSQPQVRPTGQSQQSQDMDSWGDFFDSLGMGSLNNLGNGFGETMTMLPELLTGLFTGKIKNFRLSDNLLPLGLMIGGLVLGKNNSFLKLLLIAFGALLLFANANDALHGRDRSQQARTTYRRYEDEPLNPRIKDPVVKGDTIIAQIDGRNMVLRIENDEVLDAYSKGVIPLNCLCNASLRSYDEQGGWSASLYEREMARQKQEIEERQVGIR